MQGFDPKFTDFPDYIIGITKEIWEDRNIASLHHYYAEDIVVRSPASIVVGNQGVIAATMATLAEFPDRTLFGEDVIWSGSAEQGMLSSHRLLSTATHMNTGVYGQATGTRLTYRIIADCHAINNQINDEWLIRDQGAIVRQLGLDPAEYARQQLRDEGFPEQFSRPFCSDMDKTGPYTGNGNQHETGQRYADILSRIMHAEMSVIPQEYDRACHLEYPGGVTAHSHDAADQMWMELRASFPDAQFTIHHQIGRDDAGMSPRAAIRWSLEGTHSGWGSFGRPTGAHIYVMGICHAEFGPWGLRREYVVFDETAIWKQILIHSGDV